MIFLKDALEKQDSDYVLSTTTAPIYIQHQNLVITQCPDRLSHLYDS